MEEHILRHTLALSLTLFIVIFFVAFQKQVIKHEIQNSKFCFKKYTVSSREFGITHIYTIYDKV